MSFCAALVGTECYGVAKDFATPMIAIAVAAVSFFQWRTAQKKIALDLFQRRFAAYDALRAALADIARHGNSTPETDRAFAIAQHDCQFLFGREVTEPLTKLWRAITNLHLYEINIKMDVDRSASVDKQGEAFTEITDYYLSLERLMAPYLSFHDRVPTRRWWDRLVE